VAQAPAAKSIIATEAPQEVPQPDVTPSVAANAAEPEALQDPAPAKKHFWSKLNLFKKKSVDAKEKQ